MHLSGYGKSDLLRFNVENLEDRTVAAVELLNKGLYRAVQKASGELKVQYYRLRSPLRRARSRAENGGHRTLLKTEEEEAILCWAHRRVT
ncbi:hypothetical protein BFJ63_vAg19351 [Fusarium oxysporum f. sp. narcissi]|uniref:Uncharacterized protein n=1 Tax=Fusarium oxysporum f. sp. narcissi TaxID=451672 RepID=A0A4V1RXE0_FUSOX|nr:hypothetical protein BFJ63_vAg19351 [Fusarium oxysporum f. sp. narcissi]